MTLYQQLPKDSIHTILLSRFSADQLDMVRGDLNQLLHSCCTIDELSGKLTRVLEEKCDMRDVRTRKTISEFNRELDNRLRQL
jgi:hypothetical protein